MLYMCCDGASILVEFIKQKVIFMKNIKKYTFVFVIFMVLQITSLQASYQQLNLEIDSHIIPEEREAFIKYLNTLNLGFKVLQQAGFNIPSFKDFMEKSVGEGCFQSTEECFQSALFEAQSIIVNNMKARLLRVVRESKRLGMRASRVEDPVVQFVRNQNIGSWFKADQENVPQAPSRQSPIESLINAGTVTQYDWWTHDYVGISGYSGPDTPTNIGADFGSDSELN